MWLTILVTVPHSCAVEYSTPPSKSQLPSTLSLHDTTDIFASKMGGSIQKWKVTEPYLNLHCALGEGPHYEPSTNHLRFVDIKNKRLHTVDLTAGPDSLKTLQLDMPVGVTADIEGIDPSKKILVGGKGGIYVLDRETGNYELLKNFFDNEDTTRDERLRSNDGAVDPEGRFWQGTMNDFWVGQPQPEGRQTLPF